MLYIASYVAFFRTGTNAYSSSGRYQVPGFFPGYVHTRSSPSPEPESRARVPSPSPLRSSVGPEPEPSSLDSEMDDTLVTRRTSSRTRARIRVAWLHSIYWYIQQRYTRYIYMYRYNVKSSSACIVFYNCISYIYQRYVNAGTYL